MMSNFFHDFTCNYEISVFKKGWLFQVIISKLSFNSVVGVSLAFCLSNLMYFTFSLCYTVYKLL